MKILYYSCLLLFITLTISQKVYPVKDKNHIRLSFGSCNSFTGREESEIFYTIAETKPDLWVWLGDVAYVDNNSIPPYFRYQGPEIIREKFEKVKNKPAYTKLRETTNIVGVWDDHDYASDNQGGSFPFKNITQQLWLDFIGEPQDSERRKQEGIYVSYYLGDATKIKIILLDVRYFKDDLRIFTGKNTDILGSKQWAWLENELKTNTAEWVLIGSGLQVLPDDRMIPESFFGESRERLLKLIRKYKMGGVVLLSGDVHFAEFLKYPCPKRVGVDVHEVTSSGLTHSLNSNKPPFSIHYITHMIPDTWSKADDRFFAENFAVLDFNFEGEKVLTAEIRDDQGKNVMERVIKLKDVQFNESMIDDSVSCVADKSRFRRFWDHYSNNILTGKWVVYFITLVYLLVGFLFYKLVKALVLGVKRLGVYALTRKAVVKEKIA